MYSIIAIPIQKYSMAIFFYILCKFDQDWSSNPRNNEGKNYTFWTRWQKSAFRTKYLSKYGTDRHHNFSAGRQMYADYKTGISLRLSKERCYGNRFTLGQMLKLTVFTLCSGIPKQTATSVYVCAD